MQGLGQIKSAEGADVQVVVAAGFCTGTYVYRDNSIRDVVPSLYEYLFYHGESAESTFFSTIQPTAVLYVEHSKLMTLWNLEAVLSLLLHKFSTQHQYSCCIATSTTARDFQGTADSRDI
jgi:hypothetical protein